MSDERGIIEKVFPNVAANQAAHYGRERLFVIRRLYVPSPPAGCDVESYLTDWRFNIYSIPNSIAMWWGGLKIVLTHPRGKHYSVGNVERCCKKCLFLRQTPVFPCCYACDDAVMLMSRETILLLSRLSLMMFNQLSIRLA